MVRRNRNRSDDASPDTEDLAAGVREVLPAPRPPGDGHGVRPRGVLPPHCDITEVRDAFIAASHAWIHAEGEQRRRIHNIIVRQDLLRALADVMTGITLFNMALSLLFTPLLLQIGFRLEPEVARHHPMPTRDSIAT